MRYGLLAILVLGCGPVPLVVHAQDAGGKLSGTITDASGGLIPGVRVVVRSITTWIARVLQITGIFKALDSVPSPQIAGDPLGQKSASTIDFPDRLNAPGCGAAVNPRNPGSYTRGECCVFPAPATRLGNSGRNILSGPGLVLAGLAAVKSFSIRSGWEGLRAPWQADVFNALNRANFPPPLNNLKLFDAAGRPVDSAGLLDGTATSSRQIQLALRLVW